MANKIMLAGTNSGVGKTTLSLGIMRALTKRGLHVAPFKVGPDYIDPMFHKVATSNSSYNLDAVMLKSETCKQLFSEHMRDADIGIVEGVMGLYDGLNFELDNGSSAHVAKIIDAPVILIVNAKGMAASIVPLIKGFMAYDKGVNIKGVILNHVAHKSLYTYLKKPIEEKLGIQCLGYLPPNDTIKLKSRHLGLIPTDELKEIDEQIDHMSKLVEASIDLEALLHLSKVDTEISAEMKVPIEKKFTGLKIGYACDEAFNFYYQDNLELLEKVGVELVPFSPIKDRILPEGIHGLYIGGGFPEVFKEVLESNEVMKQTILHELNNGLPAYAECGGMLYLCKGIYDLEGNYGHFVGYFDKDIQMTTRLQRFGYVTIRTLNNLTMKGHEFHRTKLVEPMEEEGFYQISKCSRPENQWIGGMRKNNVLAAYAHIHFYSNPNFVVSLLQIAESYKNSMKL